MPLAVPANSFKQRLLGGDRQIGLWTALGSSVCAELCAAGGFDWLLIDAEHGVNDVHTVLPQLQGVAAYQTQAVVRLPNDEPSLIKRYLDIGAQSLMIPMVETAEQARAIASAVAYPPHGIRGIATMTRAARWSRTPAYLAQARDEICLIAQIESVLGVENIDAIAATTGIDALLVGPADLAATLGLIGQGNHPDVWDRIWYCLERAQAAGKPAGIFVTDEERARECIARGFAFVAVGADAILLSRAVDDLRARFS